MLLGVYVTPAFVLMTIGLSIVIVSAFVDRSNRKGFIQKKIIEVLARQKEETLMKQKKEQEALIYSIFPRAIARDLIAAQKEEDDFNPAATLRSLGRKVSLSSPSFCSPRPINFPC